MFKKPSLTAASASSARARDGRPKTVFAGKLHELADEAYCIGGPRPQDSYLNEDAILTVAVASGATAIHLGYGLSENAGFARAVAANAAVRGPSPSSASRMPRAAAPRNRPRRDLLKGARRAEREAERIGCPVLIKARAGGGGRGIRKVECAQDAGKALPKPTPKPKLPSAMGNALSCRGAGARRRPWQRGHARECSVPAPKPEAHGEARRASRATDGIRDRGSTQFGARSRLRRAGSSCTDDGFSFMEMAAGQVTDNRYRFNSVEFPMQDL